MFEEAELNWVEDFTGLEEFEELEKLEEFEQLEELEQLEGLEELEDFEELEGFEEELETEDRIEDVHLAKKEYEDGIYEDIKQQMQWYEQHEKVAFCGSVSEVLIGDMEEGHMQLYITEMNKDGFLDVVADITAQPAVTQGVKRPERYCAYVEPRQEILSLIEAYSLGTDTGKRLEKDTISYPLYQFDAAKLKRLDPDGSRDYQAQVSQMEAKERQQQKQKEKHKKAKRGR